MGLVGHCRDGYSEGSGRNDRVLKRHDLTCLWKIDCRISRKKQGDKPMKGCCDHLGNVCSGLRLTCGRLRGMSALGTCSQATRTPERLVVAMDGGEESEMAL